MRWTLFCAASLASAVALGGCGEGSREVRGPVGEWGDITFLWSFDGRSCLGEPEVRWVFITLEGPRGFELLENDGYYPCRTAGVDGITLHGFAPGSYAFTVDALDAWSVVRYTASGAVRVDGDKTVRVRLLPAGSRGRLALDWSFNKDDGTGTRVRVGCADAGIASADPVDEVVLYLSGESEPRASWACASGAVEGGFIDLPPGTYSVVLDGRVTRRPEPQSPPRTEVWYRAAFSVAILTGKTQHLAVTLEPAAGGATFLPVLKSSSGDVLSCAQAGVETLWIQLVAWNGTSTPAGYYPCADYENAGFFWPWLMAYESYDASAQSWRGTWSAKITAFDASDVARFDGAMAVQVVAGLRDQLFSIPLTPR